MSRQQLDGREQTSVLATLANPETLAGYRIGDAVRLPAINCTLEVIGLADPLLILRAPSGRELRAGWQAVQRVHQAKTETTA